MSAPPVNLPPPAPPSPSRAAPVSSRSSRPNSSPDDKTEAAGAPPWTPPEISQAWQQALAQRAQGLATGAPPAGGVPAPSSLTASAMQAVGAAQAAGDAQFGQAGQAGQVIGGVAPSPVWEAQFSTAPGQAWHLRLEHAAPMAPLQPGALAVAVACSGVPAMAGGAQLPALAQRMRAKGLSVAEVAWREGPVAHQPPAGRDDEEQLR